MTASGLPAGAAKPMSSRADRIAGAVGIGYLGQATVMVIGLWLTPFLLGHLGQHQYGLSLLALQITGYLGLLDFGVVGLLPRETAYALGRSSQSTAEISGLIARTTTIAFWQIPLVLAIAALVLAFLPRDWHELRGPLLIIFAVFVVMIPLRILRAVLEGLQDLAYLGKVGVYTWAFGTAISVILVRLGFGLFGVAIGWVSSQIGSAILWWLRFPATHPRVLPRRLENSSAAGVRKWLRSGGWITLAQLGQLLLAGTDLLIIGKFLGPAAVVPYAVTGKLISVLANQPQMIMQAAQPALSESKATPGDSRIQLFRMTTALTQLMLLVSGAVVLLVIVTNEGFVGWWVKPEQFLGLSLTLALVSAMLLRHWNATLVYSLFAFGHERRIALTALLDGVIMISVAYLSVRFIGAIGAAAGSIVGVCAVSLPANIRTLSRDTGTPITPLLAPLGRWFVRFVGLLVPACAVAELLPPRTFLSLAIASTTTVVIYAIVMWSILDHEPLATYSRPRLERVKEFFA